MYTKENFKDNPFFDAVEMKYALDSLTGVFNREVVVSYAKYLIENNKTFTLCMCDIDNFKIVNDTKGHLVGDTVIVGVAKTLVNLISDRGIVGRYGGDEFLMIVEQMSEYEDVWSLCHDINICLGNYKFEDLGTLRITTTTGVARFPLNSNNYLELIGLADKALYRGKTKGRNCFIIYLPEKHANLQVHRTTDVLNSTVDLHARVFSMLTDSEMLVDNVKTLINYLSSYFMIDHLSIQTNEKNYSAIHPLARTKEFSIIPNELYEQMLCSSGYYYMNSIEVVMNKFGNKLCEELNKQKILSSLSVKMQAYGKEYGYLRADMVSSSRIWQTTELDILVTVARLISVLLHNNNLELNDIL